MLSILRWQAEVVLLLPTLLKLRSERGSAKLVPRRYVPALPSILRWRVEAALPRHLWEQESVTLVISQVPVVAPELLRVSRLAEVRRSHSAAAAIVAAVPASRQDALASSRARAALLWSVQAVTSAVPRAAASSADPSAQKTLSRPPAPYRTRHSGQAPPEPQSTRPVPRRSAASSRGCARLVGLSRR